MNKFLLISVAITGSCALGCAGRSSGSLTDQDAQLAKPAERVVVYYMHRSLRCLSCLWIESETRKSLQAAFAQELSSGEVELRIGDYWADPALARRYDVDTVSVVVIKVSGGQEVSHRNLDRVWQLKGKPEFRQYIIDAVRESLGRFGA